MARDRGGSAVADLKNRKYFKGECKIEWEVEDGTIVLHQIWCDLVWNRGDCSCAQAIPDEPDHGTQPDPSR